MNLHQLIDESLEQPTPLRLDEQLRAGRRTLRRRRVSSVLGASATAAAVVALAVTTHSAADKIALTTPQAASHGAGDKTALTTPRGPSHSGFAGQEVAGYDLNGKLVVRPGWQVVERIERPITAPVEVNGTVRRLPDRSTALAVTDGTTTQWVLAWWSNYQSNVTGTYAKPDDIGPTSLRDYVDIEVALATDGSTDAVVSVSGSDVMTGRNGVEVIDQRATPELDRAGTTTAVAKVTFPGTSPSNGWVLLVRSSQGVRTYPVIGYPVVNSKTDNGPDTVDGFVHWVAPHVTEGRYP